MPAVNKNFEDIITFTRGSGGGRYNAQGNYEWLGNDVPRFDYDPITKAVKGLLIEEQRTNLLTHSEQFGNAAWIKTRASITPNAATAPDGTMTAGKLVEDTTTSASHEIQQNRDSTSGIYTYSCFLKASERTRADIFISDGATGQIFVAVDLTNGNYVSGDANGSWTNYSYSIVAVSSGWYRVSVTGTQGAGTRLLCRVRLYQSGTMFLYTGDGTSGLYVWGAQLEQGSFPTSYIPTKATFTARNSTATYFDSQGVLRTAAANIPRYDHGYVDGQWVSKGLLLEGQSTNLLRYSEDFGNSVWTKSNCTIVPNAAIGPSGLMNASKLVENMATANHYVYEGLSTSGNTSYSLSVYVKAGERTRVYIAVGGVGWASGGASIIDLITGSTLVGTAVASNVGNGWYRVSITGVSNGATEFRGLLVSPASGLAPSYQGDGTSGIYIWGAQLEVGSSPTSYIPTPAVFTSRASTKTYFDAQGVMRTAAVDEAAIDHGLVNGVWVSKGLSAEGQATNLLLQSEAFDSERWGAVRASVVPNVVTAPDGTATADKLVEDTTANVTHYTRSNGVTITAGGVYTASLFVKPVERNTVTVQVLDTTTATNGFGSAFNLATMTATALNIGAGTCTSRSLQSVGDGWFRISVTGIVDLGSTSARSWMLVGDNGITIYTGDGTSGLYIWGAQIEAGNVPSSYIPTTTAQVTRAADVTSSAQVTRAADSSTSSQVTRAADTVALNSLSPWFNPSEGTFVIKHSVPAGQVLLSSGANNIAVSQGMGTTFVAYDAAGSYVSQNGSSPVRGEPLSFDSSFNILKSSTATSSGWIESFKYHPIRKIAADD